MPHGSRKMTDFYGKVIVFPEKLHFSRKTTHCFQILQKSDRIPSKVTHFSSKITNFHSQCLSQVVSSKGVKRIHTDPSEEGH